MKPYLSIIIPARNSLEPLKRLLYSIQQSRHCPVCEIIVVDDASSEPLDYCIKKLYKDYTPTTWSLLRFLRHPKRRGPAGARNTGAKLAKSGILVFLDSDVEVFPDTLYQIRHAFVKDPDLYALTGVWDKEQKTRKFFPRFKALRDWSYWINERDQRGYYYLFSTRIAAIRNDLFQRLGGFDERYKEALVEDIEFTYRVARRYAVVFAPQVRVHHEFEDFVPVAKKYFWRSFYWSALYRTRGKFDPVAATRSEAITAVSAVGLVLSVLVWLGIGGIRWIGKIRVMEGINLEMASSLLFGLCSLVLVIHLFGIRKFLAFVFKEEGILISIKSFFMGLMLYLIIVFGAATSLIDYYFQKIHRLKCPVPSGTRRGFAN